MEARDPSHSEIVEKDRKLQQFFAHVAAVIGEDYQWKLTIQDLSAVNWIYFEGLESRLDQSLLREGFALLLGEVLVRQHQFVWQVDPKRGLDVMSRYNSKRLFLFDLERNYAPEDIDSWEVEPFSYGDVIMKAYETVIKRV